MYLGNAILYLTPITLSNRFMDLVIIGGGAAGIFCAANAARLNAGLKVLVLEKSGKLLSKVKVSGGGRCNVTHACFDRVEMSKRYPRGQHFVRKAFHEFFTTNTIQWFEERGVKLKTESDGRMFPVTDSSQTIIDCLMREVNKHGVEIRMNTEVAALRKTDSGFEISLKDGRTLTAEAVCIATGGFAKAESFAWIESLGHSIEKPVPSLFTFNLPGHPITKLMGVSVPMAKVRISGIKTDQEGPLLITHWGLSGPAVLKSSAWGARELASRNWHFSVQVNWMSTWKENDWRELFQEQRSLHPQRSIGRCPVELPSRLWEFLVHQSGLKPEQRWGELPSRESNKLIQLLTNWEAEVKGKTTFKEEFVTAGGIKLSEIDPQTCESRIVPGLYFAGEIMDVDGITGGFNFQHAWTSGFCVAKSLGF